MKRLQFIVAIVGCAVLFLVEASARAQVFVSPRAPVVVAPTPMVVQRAPVVVSPAPVVVRPAPVMVSPSPVWVSSPRSYWVGRPYYRPWRSYRAARRAVYRSAWRGW